MEGEVKNSAFSICMNLSNHQLNIDNYTNRILWINPKVTTSEKPIITIQKTKRKKFEKNAEKKSHQTTWEERKRWKNDTEQTIKTIRKQLTNENKYTVINACLKCKQIKCSNWKSN